MAKHYHPVVELLDVKHGVFVESIFKQGFSKRQDAVASGDAHYGHDHLFEAHRLTYFSHGTFQCEDPGCQVSRAAVYPVDYPALVEMTA